MRWVWHATDKRGDKRENKIGHDFLKGRGMEGIKIYNPEKKKKE
jgi:hypothetical protein